MVRDLFLLNDCCLVVIDSHYVDLIYPNGLSCSLPEDAQERMYRSVPGLENVEIVRPAYGVEYDHVDARELKRESCVTL